MWFHKQFKFTQLLENVVYAQPQEETLFDTDNNIQDKMMRGNGEKVAMTFGKFFKY